jgi:hypothetical protein
MSEPASRAMKIAGATLPQEEPHHRGQLYVAEAHPTGVGQGGDK